MLTFSRFQNRSQIVDPDKAWVEADSMILACLEASDTATSCLPITTQTHAQSYLRPVPIEISVDNEKRTSTAARSTTRPPQLGV